MDTQLNVLRQTTDIVGGEECTRFGGNDNLKEFCIQIVLQAPLNKLRLKIVEKKDGKCQPMLKEKPGASIKQLASIYT